MSLCWIKVIGHVKFVQQTSEHAGNKPVFSLIIEMRSVSQMRKVNEINTAPWKVCCYMLIYFSQGRFQTSSLTYYVHLIKQSIQGTLKWLSIPAGISLNIPVALQTHDSQGRIASARELLILRTSLALGNLVTNEHSWVCTIKSNATFWFLFYEAAWHPCGNLRNYIDHYITFKVTGFLKKKKMTWTRVTHADTEG